jgi:hypothetical protein
MMEISESDRTDEVLAIDVSPRRKRPPCWILWIDSRVDGPMSATL